VNGAFAFSAVTPDTVDNIVIRKKEKSVSLKKSLDGWKIGDKPAKAAQVVGLLETVNSLKIEDIVSKNSANQAAFGVDDSSAAELMFLSQDKTILSMKVGNSGPNVDTLYARPVKGDEVYLLSGPLTQFLRYEPGDWQEIVTTTPTTTPKKIPSAK
ncbi:MAG: DUF4340 domain-containing protein, partial [Candidatus Magasanikbacteria bacterium]|nr:DUF4340 domain-containing protein [Candidatus Magasanikbacteria bacterium]